MTNAFIFFLLLLLFKFWEAVTTKQKSQASGRQIERHDLDGIASNCVHDGGYISKRVIGRKSDT